MPLPETLLWSRLRNNQLHGLKFRRQYGIGSYIVDFYCPKIRLAIEIDGDSHFTDENLIASDGKRQQFIETYGIEFLRFTNKEITENIEGVLNSIINQINNTTPNPS